jgi:hypothetical protein
MKISIEKWDHKISDNEILAFESKYGIQIPETYRCFLLENNVCITEPDGFFTKHVSKINKGDNPDNELGVFRVFSNETTEWNLEWLYSTYVIPARISNKYLPIALDAAGNVICLGISEDKVGKIYFWLHEDELRKPFCLADNLNAFLKSIM